MATGPARTGPFIGQSGCRYNIERVLQEETCPPRHVYVATAKNQSFILKYIHGINYDDLEAINDRLRAHASHVRLPQDTIPEKSMFVFKYFADHLLHLAQMDLSFEVRKRILKDALCGIVELHDQDIVHTDIKADNIFVDYRNDQSEILIERVQLGDLEDAAHIPPGSSMIGKQAGNWMWRSPEAHAKGPVNKPSDIFSFALVCIYAMHKRVIFAVGEDELEEGVDPLAVVIERQISYFADMDGLNGLLNHLGDNPWVQVFETIRDGFNKDNPRRPFSLWSGVDDDFKHLICAMTNFDPEMRITAREALAHKWFADV
ncbi:putative calcium/calmodulin dependent protein kinase [Aspergillus homomorphus CBS 101889]|uniref:Kinase-like protein n=1 Tax=Aspergillus homomorphus (strain CBS 101889) TaxID=1450537 RepID=A0A395HGK4_ASPHC|nr:kinase-like protein [Aspergillus homomorphus CBS 101889]RAL06639.1 kinase-like protein [Aspergillus homomorphus CBS 101889]